jgi:hypothetical protein
VILTAGLISLAIYRSVLARGECDVLHIRESEMPMVSQRATFSKRLEQLDFWDKALTIASTAYGLLLGALFLYQAWLQGPS